MLKLIYNDWNNGLYAPIVGDPEFILDCGFGTGTWAYDMAEYDPNCMVCLISLIPYSETEFPFPQVTAIDICPLLAPSDQLENIDFQVKSLVEAVLARIVDRSSTRNVGIDQEQAILLNSISTEHERLIGLVDRKSKPPLRLRRSRDL